MVKNKICTKCGKQKLFSEFYKQLSAVNNLCSWCKQCIHIQQKIYRQSSKGKQVKNKLAKKYYQAHKIECCKRNRKYEQTLIGYLRRRFYGIKQRCNNPKSMAYKHYGGRGIKCRFKNANDFIDCVINVLKIDPHGLDIDRINNNGHYERGNIRFITHSENLKNRRKYSKRK